MSFGLSPGERDALFARLERGVAETAAGFTRGALLIGGLFFLMSIALVAKGAWGVALLAGGFGAALVLLGVVAARRTSPERMRPVIEALRSSPETIVSVGHMQTSDSRKMFRTQWIEVKTAEHRLFIKANDDWQELLDRLQRLCPQAEVGGR